MYQNTKICVALKDIETRSDVASFLVLGSGPAIKVIQKCILIIISFSCFLYSRVSFSSSDALLTCLSFLELKDNRNSFWCVSVQNKCEILF